MNQAGLSLIRQSFDHFFELLEAVTVPDEGGRLIPDHPGALALSEATQKLHTAVGAAYQQIIYDYGKPLEHLPEGLLVVAAPSPDGPWKPIPSEALTACTFKIGDDGVDAALVAAMQRVVQVTGHRPPGDAEHRYTAGELIGDDFLELLRSVSRLLVIKSNERNETEAPPKGKRRGRKLDSDPKADERIADAWTTGEYKSFADLGREHDMSKEQVRRAIDRHRKRR